MQTLSGRKSFHVFRKWEEIKGKSTILTWQGVARDEVKEQRSVGQVRDRGLHPRGGRKSLMLSLKVEESHNLICIF